MSSTTKKAVSFSAMALILAVVITANILAAMFFNMITIFLFGTGVNFDGIDFSKGDEIVREIAAEGIVMLKNDNDTLPIPKGKVNVLGWSASDGGFVLSGSGSGSASERQDASKQVKFLDGLTESGFTYNEDIIDFYESYKSTREGRSLSPGDTNLFFRLYEPTIDAYGSLWQEAIDYSSTAIVVIGRLGGEGQDLPFVQYKSQGTTTASGVTTDSTRTYLQISTEEEALLEKACEDFETVVVLLNTCNAMELSFIGLIDGIDAVLSVGALGQSGATAIPKILSGEVNPSGKTVDIYAYDHKTDPTYANAYATSATSYQGGGYYLDYSEGIYIGYRYYETAAYENVINYNSTVQFPFGFGLSYTTFEWTVNSVTPSNLTKDGQIEIKVTVENTGDVKGKEVVQVYFTAPYFDGQIEKPYVQLCGFAKTSLLEPDEFEQLTITIKVSDLASYDYNDANNNGFYGYELDAGTYEIKLQTDSHNLADCDRAKTTFTLNSGIRYEQDPVTGHDVGNLFTGSDAYAGISIDGSNTGAGITYLSRTDLSDLPQKITNRSKHALITANSEFMTDKSDTTETFTQGTGGNLKLTYEENGSLKFNEDLVKLLGANFEDEAWEDLLDQLTYTDISNLISMGGYSTAAAPSVGKPECLDLDGPSGINQRNQSDVETFWNGYPVETVIASTWSEQLAYVMGLSVGYEAYETGVSGWYAPAMNMHRSPYAGRNFEYYSEDPFLSGKMGAQTTLGATNNGLYCYIKHFAVNDSEWYRDSDGLYTWLTEQALREIYLKPFEITVKQGKANAVMSSFNRVGAIWAGSNYDLLTTVLRGEWGFKGSVITDYYNKPYMDISRGLRAGNDLWLDPSNNNLPTSIRPSATASATTNYITRRAAKNILYTYCNTQYMQMTYNPEDDTFVTEGGVKTRNLPFPSWIFALIAIDIAAVAGLGIWTYFLLFRKKQELINN